MSKGKKQDNTEKKRERADLVARILQQRCPELRDLKYQNFEAKNDPPDLVFGEKASNTGAFPIGIELMEFHRGELTEKGSLLRRIEEQKEKITNAAWEKYRSANSDELYVVLFWKETEKSISDDGELPVKQPEEAAIVANLVRLVEAQKHRATAAGISIDNASIAEANLAKHVFGIWLWKQVEKDGIAYSSWSSNSRQFIGVYPEQLERYIQKKEGKLFKHTCEEKWLILIIDAEGKLSTHMQFLDFRSIQSQYFNRVYVLGLTSRKFNMIFPRLRELSGAL